MKRFKSYILIIFSAMALFATSCTDEEVLPTGEEESDPVVIVDDGHSGGGQSGSGS